MVEDGQGVGGNLMVDSRYHNSRLPDDATGLPKAARSQWSVATRLHLSPDIRFSEDAAQVREGSRLGNFSALRRIALNPLKA